MSPKRIGLSRGECLKTADQQGRACRVCARDFPAACSHAPYGGVNARLAAAGRAVAEREPLDRRAGDYRGHPSQVAGKDQKCIDRLWLTFHRWHGNLAAWGALGALTVLPADPILWGERVIRMNGYASLCDDFYVNMNLGTEMELPANRETVLHFFERVQKTYPTMRNFYCRERGDFVLEEDKDQGAYRWCTIEPRRVCSGQVNPESIDEAMEQHKLVLELAPYMLSVSPLDCEALDLLFGFDFTYRGNHNQLMAEALGVSPSMEPVAGYPRRDRDQLRAVVDRRHGFRLPSATPHQRRDPHQRLPDPHGRLSRKNN